jgi:predicted ATPase
MAGTAVAGLNGFVPPLTSFVGRAYQVDEVAGLLGEYRLVTVTGPGGVGKTRLAGEVARRVAGRFADGVWLVELAGVQEPSLVSAAVAVALGLRQPPGMSIVESLAAALARQQLLVVLDNCEHVAEAAAKLCGTLLPAADDVRILATSREPVGIGGETHYRLPPLTLPGLADPAGIAGSEAVALFADRARQVDPHFDVDGETGPVVARLMTRLDGMPLAIELAAARVEALGVAQLLERLDDGFALLAGGDRLAAARQRSLAATVEWSYQLLSEDERRVFRQLAVFPGPFTLAAAEMIAGAAAGPAVLHLVDCSLLAPPRPGPDGRARYAMLETLRAYGLERLAGAGAQTGAAALAEYALQVAERAAAGMQTSGGELGAARWLDAENATTQLALDWALEHDPAAALRLATALAPWWMLRGRWASGYALLHAAARHTAPGDDAWCAAQFWLGQTAGLNGDMTGALGHAAAAYDALAARETSPALIEALILRANSLLNLGRIPEGVEDAHRALALAREIGYPEGEAAALHELSIAAHYADDAENALEWARQACRVDQAAISDSCARSNSASLAIGLIDVGEVTAALRCCADLLTQARDVGDLDTQALCLVLMAELDRRTGRIPEATADLRELLELGPLMGHWFRLIDCLIPHARVKIHPDSAHGFRFQDHTEFADDVHTFPTAAGRQAHWAGRA